MKWITKKFGFKDFKSVFLLVWLVLLSLVLSLSHSLPASADTLSNIKPLGIGSNGIDHSNLPISSVSAYSGGVGFQVYGYGNNTSPKDIYLGLQNLTTIPANSLVYVTMSVTGSNINDAPLCFTGGWNHEVIDCDINGDNGNYTVSGLFYIANSRTSIALYNYVRNDNLYYASSAPYVSITGYQATINQSLTADDVANIKQRLSNINDDVYNSRLKLDDIIASLNTNSSQLSTINQSVIAQGQATQQAIEDQTEQQQDQYEAEKAEESQRETQAEGDADNMSGLFSFSLFNPFSNLLALFTDGSSCVSIPNFARLVGSSEIQFCPWFPSWVRNMLTPVIALVSSFFLFRYIWKWLGDDASGLVEYTGGKG